MEDCDEVSQKGRACRVPQDLIIPSSEGYAQRVLSLCKHHGKLLSWQETRAVSRFGKAMLAVVQRMDGGLGELEAGR